MKLGASNVPSNAILLQLVWASLPLRGNPSWLQKHTRTTEIRSDTVRNMVRIRLDYKAGPTGDEIQATVSGSAAAFDLGSGGIEFNIKRPVGRKRPICRARPFAEFSTS